MLSVATITALGKPSSASTRTRPDCAGPSHAWRKKLLATYCRPDPRLPPVAGTRRVPYAFGRHGHSMRNERHTACACYGSSAHRQGRYWPLESPWAGWPRVIAHPSSLGVLSLATIAALGKPSSASTKARPHCAGPSHAWRKNCLLPIAGLNPDFPEK